MVNCNQLNLLTFKMVNTRCLTHTMPIFSPKVDFYTIACIKNISLHYKLSFMLAQNSFI